MTYKEFYDTVVYAMLNGDAETLEAMHDLNLRWWVQCTDDVEDTLKKYTMFGIDA